jgi:hypothetical protein
VLLPCYCLPLHARHESDTLRKQLFAEYKVEDLVKLDDPPADAKDPIAAAFALYVADDRFEGGEIDESPDLESWLYGEAITETGLELWQCKLEEMDTERKCIIKEIEIDLNSHELDALASLSTATASASASAAAPSAGTPPASPTKKQKI